MNNKFCCKNKFIPKKVLTFSKQTLQQNYLSKIPSMFMQQVAFHHNEQCRLSIKHGMREKSNSPDWDLNPRSLTPQSVRSCLLYCLIHLVDFVSKLNTELHDHSFTLSVV